MKKKIVLALTILVIASLACGFDLGNTTQPPQVVVVTATSGPQVIVITATNQPATQTPYPTYTVQPATPTPQVIVITATGPAATNTPTPVPFKFVSAFIKPTKGTCNYYVTGWGFTPNIEVTLVTESAAATLNTKVKTDDKGFFSIMLVKNFNLGGFVGRPITTTAYDSKGNYLADAVETVPDACPKN